MMNYIFVVVTLLWLFYGAYLAKFFICNISRENNLIGNFVLLLLTVFCVFFGAYFGFIVWINKISEKKFGIKVARFIPCLIGVATGVCLLIFLKKEINWWFVLMFPLVYGYSCTVDWEMPKIPKKQEKT